MYHGALVERHGLDLAVLALQKIRKTIPNAELRIYGRNTPFLEQVLDLVRKLDLSAAVKYLGPKNLEQIPDAINECDVGIIPNRRSKFTELNTPTRIFEFLSQAKPVIAPKSSGVLEYFGPEELVHFELGNAEDLAAKIEYVFGNPEECAKIFQRGQEACLKYKWSSERIRFWSGGSAFKRNVEFVASKCHALYLGECQRGGGRRAASATRHSGRRTGLKLNAIFSRHFHDQPQVRLSFFEFFAASRKEAIKATWHAHHCHREIVVPRTLGA